MSNVSIMFCNDMSLSRGYDFVEVLEWFAGRVDLVLLLFDAHKLDISDELRRAILALTRWEEKIRIILNKADGVDSQQLMRVYGALMWSLGKVLTCPEVPRVYISSWWDHQLTHAQSRALFELEEQDLFSDFRALPRAATLRKLNDLIKRARLARVMALIADELSSSLPVIRREAAKKNLLKGLEEVIQRVENRHGHCTGDLPPIEKLRETLSRADWSKFRSVDKRQLVKLDRLLTEEMAKLVAMLPSEMSAMGQAVLNGPIEASQAVGLSRTAEDGHLQHLDAIGQALKVTAHCLMRCDKLLPPPPPPLPPPPPHTPFQKGPAKHCSRQPAGR